MSKGRIDPYKAAGIAFGLGKLNTLSDTASFGALLGAIGAFDNESADDPPITVHKPSQNTQSEMREKTMKYLCSTMMIFMTIMIMI